MSEMKLQPDIPAKVRTILIKTKATSKDVLCCTLPRSDGSLTVVDKCRHGIDLASQFRL
jgi:hypothetical protein